MHTVFQDRGIKSVRLICLCNLIVIIVLYDYIFFNSQGVLILSSNIMIYIRCSTIHCVHKGYSIECHQVTGCIQQLNLHSLFISLLMLYDCDFKFSSDPPVNGRGSYDSMTNLPLSCICIWNSWF